MILATQWILFMSCVNHGSSGGLVGAFKGARGGGKEKKYIKLAKEKEWGLFGKGMKLSF
jgi:hypothetical protein